MATRLHRREMVTVGAWALAYFAAHLVAFYFPDTERIIMAVWPAAGIGLAALLLSPRAWWPWLLSAFVVVGVGADVAMAHRPFAASVGYMAANIVESIACALLIIRAGGRDVRFDRLAPLVALLAAALGVNAITACIGAGASVLAAHGVFGDAWLTWYVSDALGILLVAPLIVAWARGRESELPARPARVIESIAFLALWCAVAWFVSNPPAGYRLLPYMIIALLAWPAFRLRWPVVPTALVLLALVDIGDAVLHPGSSALSGTNVEETLFNIQLFLAVAASVGFLLAASFAETRAAAQAAREGEERLQLAFRGSTDAAWDWDLTSNTVTFSPRWWEMLGYAEDEVPAEPGLWLRWMDPSDAPHTQEVIGSARAHGADYWEVEARVRHKGGHYVPILTRGFILRNSTGAPVRMSGTNTDLTERKQAAAALLESQVKLTVAMEQAHLAHWGMDAATNTFTFNDRFWALCGTTADAEGGYEMPAGDFAREFLLPDDEHMVADDIAKLLSGAIDTLQQEHRLRRRDGALRDIAVRIMVVRDATGRVVGTQGVNQDITERKQAEVALAQNAALLAISEQQMSMSQQLGGTGTWVLDIRANEIWGSVGGTNLFRLPAGEGQYPIAEIEACIPDRARVHQALVDLISEEREYDLEYLINPADGSPARYMHSIARLERDTDGAPRRVLGFIQDITERKQAEQALAMSEASYREQFERNGTVMLLIDPADATIVEANAAALTFYGYSRNELLGMRITDLNMLPAADVIRAVATVPDHHGRRFEFPHRLANGEVRYVEVSASRVQFGGRMVLHSIVHDVTSRKRAEEALEMERVALAASQALGHLGSWEYFADTRKTSWSAEQCRIYGIPPQAMSPPYDEMLTHHIHPDDAALLQETFAQAMRNGSVFELEHRIVRPDGSVRVTYDRALPHFDEHGKLVRYMGSTLDITDRKRAEMALRESEGRFRSLTEELQIGVLVQGPNAEILLSNPKALELLGLTEDQLLGKTSFDPHWNVIHDDGSPFPGPTHPVVQALATRAPVRNVVMGVQRPVIHDRVWLLVNAEPQLNADGSVREVVCTFADMTAQRAMEAERTRLAEEIQQAHKMESVGRLAGGVAHDYNNMLAVIIGHAELGLQEADAPPALRDSLWEIHKAATHSAEITKQLLTFARKQVIQPHRLDLNATVGHALQMLRPLIGERVQFAWHPAEELWPITMDATQMEQVLTNLCLNARDAITGPGTVVVTTSNHVVDATLRETVAEAVPGDYVRLTVTDSGCGMSPAVLARVFEPFYTTKGVGEGSGLGLASVYGAVRQNGGFVGVASVEGEGTTFDIYLPRREGTLSGPRVSESRAPMVRGRETVLVVEDEPAVRRMTVRSLELQGYTVLAADGPLAAIRLAQERGGGIALLLTDVQMPEMSGHDLAAFLQSSQPRLKHLFMSAYPMQSSEGDGQMEDAAHFLAKPFSLAALTAKVREVLDGG